MTRPRPRCCCACCHTGSADQPLRDDPRGAGTSSGQLCDGRTGAAVRGIQLHHSCYSVAQRADLAGVAIRLGHSVSVANSRSIMWRPRTGSGSVRASRHGTSTPARLSPASTPTTCRWPARTPCGRSWMPRPRRDQTPGDAAAPSRHHPAEGTGPRTAGPGRLHGAAGARCEVPRVRDRHRRRDQPQLVRAVVQ
jgi:hypothetical protein